MNNAGYILLLIVLFSGCAKDDENSAFTPTSVAGRVFDLERNRAFVNEKILLNSSFWCGSGFTGGTCYSLVDSAFTDVNGKYVFDFDYDENRTYYINLDVDYPFYPREKDLRTLQKGEMNVENFEIWRPLIFELDIKVRNNDSPPLRIYSADEADFYNDLNFPRHTIEEQSIDTVLYVHAKPNALMRLEFNFNDPTNAYHERLEFINTGRQDTIALILEIDCTTF
jgi:hypothetical protein